MSPFGALESVELVIAHRDIGEACRIEMGQLRRCTVLRIQGEQIRRRLQRAARDHDRMAGDAETLDLPGATQFRRLAGLDIDREQRMFAIVVGRRIQGLAVLRQLQAAWRTVPLRIDFARLPRGKVERHDAEAVGLEGRALHRQVIQGLAVRGRQRIGVPGQIYRGQVLRRRRSVGGNGIDVEIGRPRLRVTGNAHIEIDRTAIRREREFTVVAERFGRYIAVDALRQQLRRPRFFHPRRLPQCIIVNAGRRPRYPSGG